MKIVEIDRPPGRILAGLESTKGHRRPLDQLDFRAEHGHARKLCEAAHALDGWGISGRLWLHAFKRGP
jgi:hypothetical protein